MKTRKQMRGFDITQYLAFDTFPNIQNVELIPVSNNHFDIAIMDKRTGEVVHGECMSIDDCRQLAKQANKMIRDNTKWLEEHYEEH